MSDERQAPVRKGEGEAVQDPALVGGGGSWSSLAQPYPPQPPLSWAHLTCVPIHAPVSFLNICAVCSEVGHLSRPASTSYLGSQRVSSSHFLVVKTGVRSAVKLRRSAVVGGSARHVSLLLWLLLLTVCVLRPFPAPAGLQRGR